MSKITYTRWNDELIIEQIREQSSDGVAPSTRDEDGNATLLSRAARSRFGSWERACEQAGVQPLKWEWTKEMVLEALRERSVDGIAPSTNDENTLATVARRYWPSWRDACREAGVRPRTEPEDECRMCGDPLDPDGTRIAYCSDACVQELRREWAFNADASQRLRAGATYEWVARRDVWERDEGICGWCFGAVDPELAYPHPLSASMDHRVALSNGGHHEISNVQLLHSKCNHMKYIEMDRHYQAA
jgi:hypothetical protein